MSEFLKCDADGCDYRENVAAVTQEMVGKLCPKCGANLLTQGDFDFYRSVLKPGFNMMERLGFMVPADEDTPEKRKIAFNNHDGEIRIRLGTGQWPESREK